MSAEPDDTDEALRAALLEATPAARERLRTAAGALRRHAAAETGLVTWSSLTGDGTRADPYVLPHPDYAEPVDELIAALRGAHAQPTVDWMAWDGPRRYVGGVGLSEAPVADAMRLVTAIVRGERFCDGTIAGAVEDGTLVAAAERIVAELDASQRP